MEKTASAFTPEDRIGALEIQGISVLDNRALLQERAKDGVREPAQIRGEEIVGSERGIAEIDPAGRKLRDVTPTVADAPGDTAAKVLAAFIADIEAVGVEAVRQDWPDLIVTYERARAALAATLVG